ncbi:unnamed protein product [Rodentolepis nana]|uniref:Btz domain-containing protein n=1 Tax=Rodentolepis nana TaxID=102285 RepID=A0A0R3TPC9_RODNA|nr:unnamed protein product [Rodentolepis nana]
MSSRRVDIRTTRKARPISESISTPSSNTRTRSDVQAPQKNARKKSGKLSKAPSSKKDDSTSKPEQLSPNFDAQMKSRRRRADTSDYIRRRFLYDDNEGENSKEKSNKSKTSKSLKRVSSHETKYRTSPLALMAASSANYQRNRKKNTDRSPSPVRSRSPRGRRGRRPRVFSPDMGEYSEDNLSNYDVGASGDEEFSEGIEGRISESYSHRHSRVEYDENTQLIKPMFRRVQKRDSYRTEDFHSESHQNYESNIPDLIFDDGIPDFTRRRGPISLSRRVRHRIVPRTSLSRDVNKEMPDYNENYDMADSDPDFRHQVRGNFPLDHNISMEDSSRLEVGDWGGHIAGIESDDLNSNNRQAPVEIEDFAGDLLPQTATSSNCPPSSGSSRRKSPVRPMQVIRNEIPLYHSENGGNLGHSSGANLIQPTSTASAGLVDLCAAAVLDSSGQTSVPASQTSTQIPISNVQASSVQPIIANAAQYSLINPGLVSLQTDGRVFVDTSVRAPITGYTITSTPPMSKISLMQGRINYGTPQNASKSRSSTSLAASSKGGGLSNSLANSSTRRRPTILKRKEVPPTSSTIAPPPPRKASPVNRPPPPPFMRNALRNMQTSPLISTLQRSVRPVTYTIVSPGQAGGIFTVTPTSNLQQSSTPSASSQTASSRLFGTKRASAGSITEVRPIPPSQSNVAVISCLPAQSIVNPSYRNCE